MDPAKLAITQALNHDWKAAIVTNLHILDLEPENVDALNRLARAYIETGKIKNAKQVASKALLIDPINTIALRCIEKCKSLKSGITLNQGNIDPEAFLEVPGKTKMVDLIHLGDELIMAQLDSGDEVQLVAHSHRVSVTTKDGKYIGRLPDDISARLRNLIKDGNKYQTLIKNVNKKSIRIFIRGESISFPTEKIEYTSFTPPELVHKDNPISEDLESPSESIT